MVARGGMGLVALALVAMLIAPAGVLAEDQPAKGPGVVIEGELATLADGVGPAVVGVSVPGGRGAAAESQGGEEQDPSGSGGARRRSQTGAGVVIAPGGLILTTAAVVPEGAGRIVVTLEGGRRLKAREVRRDARSGLVLLEVEARGLRAATLGDARALKPGSIVATFGNPFGAITRDGEAAMSIGVLSAVAGSTLETDAAVNPGSFGGPLVDVHGHVVGIVVPEFRNERWLGLARAIDADVLAFVGAARSEALAASPSEERWGGTAAVADGEEGAEAERGVLGIYIFEDDEQPGGAKIEKVMPGSAAEQAKLKPGDVIVTMNGRKIPSSAALAKRLRTVRPGEDVTFKVEREGFEREVTLKARSRPEAERPAKPYLGLFAVNRPGGEGILIDEVVAGGPAAKAGLKKGDVIRAIDGKPIRETDDLGRALEGKKPGQKVGIEIGRIMDGTLWSKKAKVTLGRRPSEKTAEAPERPERPERPARPVRPRPAEKKPGFLGLYLRDVEGGVLIENVIPDSPAEKAGLKSGDVIVRVAGKEAGTIETFTAALSKYGAGDRVELLIKRGEGWEKPVEVILGPRPSEIPPPPEPPEEGEGLPPGHPPVPERPKAPAPSEEAKPGFLGLRVQETDEGLQVIEVLPGTAAEKAGLKAGAVIAEIDGTRVDSMAAFARAMRSRKAGEKVVLKFADGSSVTVTLGPRP